MNENPNSEPRINLWQDTAGCWRRLPNKAFFFALLAAWLALFQFLGNTTLGYVHTPSLLSWLVDQYDNPVADDGHGNFIPFLVIGLFWWKRRELLALPLKLWWPGLLILAAALALHAAGYAVQQTYLSVAALFAGIYGLMGLAWGREWLRHSLFPFFLFMFSFPLGQRAEFITFPLRQLVSWLSEEVAHWVLGIDVIRVGTQLLDPSGSYGFDVQAPCSGMRSLIAIFLLATVYGFFAFRSSWKRLLLMALALPFAVLGNLARMLLIIMSAELGGQSWGNYVHEGGPLGIISLVPYLPAMIGLLLIGRWLEKGEKKHERANG
jgi:exosortase